MKKNYIVAISILIGLWVAFMAYRHVTRKQETEQYEAKEYSRVTVIARQSPRAGLGQMARALQKYYEKKQAYPSRLIELYPEYLGNKSFIEEIDWYYEPRGNNFYLSKTVIRDNRRMVASIDRGLMPRVETGVMVAAPTPTPKPAQAERREGLFAERPEISITSREEFWEMLRLREKGITPASWAKRDKRRIIASIRPEILSVVELDATSTLEDQLSQRYLVWKDRNGILGIGNVQYPATQRQTVYAMGSWYDIKVPFPTEEGPITPDAKTAKKTGGPEVIASSLSQRHLVWRSRHGILGFGNVGYPQRDRVSVFQDDGWVNVERPVTPAETSKEEAYEPEQGKPVETIASELSTRYLVWKDEKTLGFGNVGYPQRDRVSVFQDDGWVNVERPVAPAETSNEEAYEPEQGKPVETIASELSTRYLVWKDEKTLGFGNVGYPQRDRVSVFQDDGWVNVERPPPLPADIRAEGDYGSQKAKPPEKITSELSNRYLVWKDQHGTLGFGNVEYPETDNISHVHVNGSWEKVIN